MRFKLLRLFIVAGIVLLGFFVLLNFSKVKVVSSGITKKFYSSSSRNYSNLDSSFNLTARADTSEASRNIGPYIGTIISIVRLILSLVGWGLLIIGVPVSLIKKSKLISEEKELKERYNNEEGKQLNNEMNTVLNLKKNNKIRLILKIIIGIIFVLISVILGIMQNMAVLL